MAETTTAASDAPEDRRSPFWRTTFASLAERDFAWFFTSNFAFFMAMQMQFLLFGYLALALTGSAKALGVVSAANTVPSLLAAPFTGALADRLHKRLILAVSQTVAVLMSATLGILIITGLVEFWHLVVCSMFAGIVMALNMPARQSIVPQLVPRHKLMNAISLQMGEMNLTRIIAPAMAGVLIAPLGVGWVFLIGSALFFSATAAEVNLPKHGLTGHDRESRFLDEVGEGFRFIWNNSMLRLLILSNTLLPMFAFPVQQTLPVFAREVFERGPTGLGWLAAVSGVGGLIGAIVSANMDRQPRKGRLMLLGGTVMGGFYAAFALSPAFEMALLFLGLAAIGQMLFMTTNNTVIQSSLPPEIRGRVMAVMSMSIGLTPLSLFPIAVAVDEVGAPLTIAVSSGVMLALLALIFWLSPRLRGLRLDALDRARMSPAQAASLVAEGKLSQEEANEATGARA